MNSSKLFYIKTLQNIFLRNEISRKQKQKKERTKNGNQKNS